jgi:FMN-dependent NADH-azoreductase
MQPIPKDLEVVMSTLLHVNSSPRGALSQSWQLGCAFLDALSERVPSLTVETLDLFAEPLPEFGADAAAAKYAAFAGAEVTGAGAHAWSQARTVFDRFAGADAYLFTVPMWNAGVPYVLKQWIDLVTQPGWAFAFDPTIGYTGLVTGRPAAVVYTSGVYAPGVSLAFGADFCSTFFADWLRFVGIADVVTTRYAANAMSATPDADFQAAVADARTLAETFSLVDDARLPAEAAA